MDDPGDPLVLRNPSDFAEELVYWFLRLNGCFTVRNFILHPETRGSARAEADTLGVRFPGHRELHLGARPLRDHPEFDGSRYIDVVVAEATHGQPCKLNPTINDPNRGHLSEVLDFIGVLEDHREVAERLPAWGAFQSNGLRFRMFAFGDEVDAELHERQPGAVQLSWKEVTEFFHVRFTDHFKRKKFNPQWEHVGRWLFYHATNEPLDAFAERVRIAVRARTWA